MQKFYCLLDESSHFENGRNLDHLGINPKAPSKAISG